ncbi:MAG: DUF6148 family protein [Burkholderiaceae bacterium]|jgi:hypothetical protein|nr:DUF6148 family protein [Burkholderiaceae bacterium]
MAGLTLAQAQAQLDAYLAAETAVLGGQEYEIGGRRLRRADLRSIQQGITLWNQRVQELSARGSGRGRSITPTPNF